MAMAAKRTNRAGVAAAQDVTLRLSSGETLGVIKPSPELERLALEWSYLVRNRRRWLARSEAREALSRRARDDLATMGIGPGMLARVHGHPVLEIAIGAEDSDWPARVLPWEAMIARATAEFRSGSPMLVVRHLTVKATKPPRRGVFRRVLFVESEPGPLAGIYDFRSERNHVLGGLQIGGQVSMSPTLDELEKAVQERKPDLIHLTGLDAREAFTHSSVVSSEHDARSSDDRDANDGFALRDEDPSMYRVVRPTELASRLTRTHSPRLVACNFYNSGVRTASELVRAGVDAAIGFRDEMNDAVAEMFFSDFYRALHMHQGDVLRAARWAWENIFRAKRSNLIGSGVVLWSARSLVDKRVEERTDADKRLDTERKRTIDASQMTQESLREVLEVRIKPRESLNYALLHNGRGLFEEFRLTKNQSGRLHDVHVEVLLYNGGDSFAYRKSLVLENSVEDLAPLVRAPLTSPLGRTLRESIRTSLYATVKVGQQVLFSDTYPVTLLPPDEWRDDSLDGPWLPSFVLPRDGVVPKVIAAAQKYLVAIADSRDIGFDGYQRQEKGDAVEQQVRAIWYALSQDYGLFYITAPATFSGSSQRLRSPTEVLQGGRGTCIDLALLFAACLEHVRIHPVLFLLKRHARAGFWATDDAHALFEQTRFAADELGGKAAANQAWRGQRVPWQVLQDSAQLSELRAHLRNGNLVAVETQDLTTRASWAIARMSGTDSVSNGTLGTFESMLDVRIARTAGVTPLPIGEV
jgi:hypothetical protein